MLRIHLFILILLFHGVLCHHNSLNNGGSLLAPEPCHICINVIQQMVTGNTYLLPSICTSLLNQFQPESYPICNEVINSIGENSGGVRNWINKGCWKSEIYGEKELVMPCPFHVICSKLKGLSGSSFCREQAPDTPYEVASKTTEASSDSGAATPTPATGAASE